MSASQEKSAGLEPATPSLPWTARRRGGLPGPSVARWRSAPSSVASSRFCVREPRTLDTRRAELSALKARPAEVSAAEVCGTECGASEVGADEICILEMGTDEIGLPQVG